MSSRFPWQVTNEQLAEDLDVGVRTLQHAKSVAKRLGVLKIEMDCGSGGRRADRLSVNLDGLRAYQKQHEPPCEIGAAPRKVRMAPRKVRMAPRENSAAYKERSSSSSSISSKEPSPSVSSDPAAKRSVPEAAEDWQTVEGALGKLGMEAAGRCAAMARWKGYALAEMQALIAYWQEHPGAWRIGALWSRIENSAAGRAIAEGWPPMDESYLRQAEWRARVERERQQAAAEVAKDVARRAEAQAKLAELQALEAKHLPGLEALDRESLLALAGELFGDGLLLQRFEKLGLADDSLRWLLMERLDKRGSGP